MNKTIRNLIPSCNRCHVDMTLGIAIGPTCPDWLKHAISDPPGNLLINHETIKFETVWKCPKCGHSQDLN